MIIISGGDDSRMREIIQDALTEAGEPFILTEDESDIISTEQAVALVVYNANKIRTYLGRLERNTRKQEENLRSQAVTMQNIEAFLEPLGVYFETQLDDDVPTLVRRTNVQSRLNYVRDRRAKEIQHAREREAEKESS